MRRLSFAILLALSLSPAFGQAPAPVPALPDTERRTSYSISASTCACSIGMQLYGDSTDVANWLRVFVNGVEISQSGNWSVTSPSGQIATLARPISDAVLTFTSAQTGTVQIVGAQRPRRLTEVSENRGVAARDFNQFANTVTAELRELWDRFTRTPQVPPGEITTNLPPSASRANMGVCFDANGYFQPCVSVPSGTFTAGTGIAFTGTNPTTISNSAPTYTAGSGITFTGTSPTTISLTPTVSTATPIIPSRVIAQTLDLHALATVQTGGYTTGGDGGGATFKNVGAGTFIDQFFGGGYGSLTIQAAGSGYTPGTYTGVPFGNGTGINCMGQVTVNGDGTIHAGGVVIIVPCVAYVTNDILIVVNSFIGGTGSGLQIKVAAVTTPLGSFTDSVGTHFQIIPGGNFLNIKQFGAKMDWHLGNDLIATDDTAGIQAAMSFASYNGAVGQVDGHSPGNGGYAGQTVLVPGGASLYCDNANSSSSNTGLVIPQGVWLKGQGVLSSVLHHCTTAGVGNGNVNPITLCDTVSSVGQFGCRISDMTLEDPQTNGQNVTAVIYSNSGQQQTLGDNLLIVTASRGCVKYEIGKGGAANDIWHDVDCEMASANTNSGFHLNAASTQHVLRQVVFGCGACSGSAINHLAGRLITDTIDVEGFANGLNQTVSTSGNVSVYRNVQQNSNNCTQAITVTGTNTPGNILFENVATTCPITITNGQAGGANFTGNIVKPITCVAGACS